MLSRDIISSIFNQQTPFFQIEIEAAPPSLSPLVGELGAGVHGLAGIMEAAELAVSEVGAECDQCWWVPM